MLVVIVFDEIVLDVIVLDVIVLVAIDELLITVLTVVLPIRMAVVLATTSAPTATEAV